MFENPKLPEGAPDNEYGNKRDADQIDFDLPENKEGKENKFKLLKCLSRLTKWGLVAGAVYVTFETERKLLDNEEAYRSHISHVLGPEQQKKKEELIGKLTSLYGKENIRLIEEYDKQAFVSSYNEKERQDNVDSVEIKNEPPGLENFGRYGITENYGVYPKNWIKGEVASVNFVDEDELDEIDFGETAGQYKDGLILFDDVFVSKSRIDLSKSYTTANVASEVSETVAHELGHANDWDTDKDLNITERLDLLDSVTKRMLSDDAYTHGEGKEYHEKFIDGTKKGQYRAAKEYWADICAGFFQHPKEFKEEYPKDFELVEKFVKKNDPTFDVLSKDRGAFDPQTGKLRDVWQKSEN